MQVQSDTTSFPANGGSGVISITVTRECGWAVQTEATWLALQTDPSGQGEGSVRFTVASNGDPASRNARLTVNGQELQISQAGTPCAFRLSSTREMAVASGEQRTVQVESSSVQCQWSATSNVPWSTIIGGQMHTGSGALQFEVAALLGPPRIGTLTIAGQRVEVEQGTGCTYTTDVTALSIGPEGRTSELGVTAPAGCTWKADSQAPWITILSGEVGSGSGRAMVRVDATAGPTRTGTIVVAGRTLTVTQSSGCAVMVQPASHALPVVGGAGAVTVGAAAGCAWAVTTNAPWIVIIAGNSGSGAGQVQFTVAANTGPARSGSLAIGGQAVPISQPSGCTFSLDPGLFTLGPPAQTNTVSVSTGTACGWNAATADAPWLSIPVSSGSGPAQLSFAVTANNGPPRSSVFVVAGNPVSVTQASACTWGVSPRIHEMSAEGGRGNVLLIVDGPCTWTASSATSWITMQAGTSGAGNGLVQFLVAANPGPARTGIVKVAGFDYLVMQSPR
ncbi:MAG: BACON domain-containing carbohydrate-binding protein [Vicinamibacterales bacterium]